VRSPTERGRGDRVIREKTERQDDGASDVDDGSMVLMFDIKGGQPRGGGIGASAETHEKEKEKKRDDHTLNAMLPNTTSGSASLNRKKVPISCRVRRGGGGYAHVIAALGIWDAKKMV
jgi:hypothetical protein